MCFYRFKTKITEPSPAYAQWLAKQKTVEDIINFANDFTYVSDKEQFGKSDHWQKVCSGFQLIKNYPIRRFYNGYSDQRLCCCYL